jgi:polysaccharide export outer membrane protein
MVRTGKLLGAWAGLLLLFFLTVVGRMAAQEADRGDNPQERGSGTRAVEPSDLTRDNLERVAATAEQILAVLNKDPGLMVEMKRQVAQDAAAGGQILEESDLSDAAIAERLRQDVRTRALATRLLQRYGYMQPRPYPGTNPAAAKSFHEPHAPSASGGTAPCDPKSPSNCALPEKGDVLTKRQPDTAPPPVQVPQRTDGAAAELRPSAVAPAAAPAAETLLAVNSGNPVVPRDTNSQQKTSSPMMDVVVAAPPGALAATGEADGALPPELSSNEGTRPVAAAPMAVGSGAGSENLDPVRMERRPNPYADVPALYDLYVQAAVNHKPAERFGLDVFRKGAPQLGYLPMDLPVGPDYVVGPGDGLSIDLWGGVSQRLIRVVDREGRVSLPETGPLLVSGRTLGEVQAAVQHMLRSQFRDVSADVSLSRLRTVRVYVVGDVATPGAYDVSSLSTPLNALFTSGGVTARGSLRRIEHFRGKQLVEEVDAYDLLLHGVRGNLQRLENGDSLRVPPLGALVTVDGMVRRPATYELLREKNLEDVLDLAGGILPAAALRHIEVQRLVVHEKRTMLSLDIGDASAPEAIRGQLRRFPVQDGDEVHIFPIAPYNTDAVYLEGHVLRPGRYSYHKGMKLTDLVASYQELLPEPAGQYAEVIRLHAPDYHPIVESFSLAAALAHPESAPKLEPLDTVRIFGRFDFEGAPEVLVTGEVRAPGRYRTSGQQHVRDAIYQAGGVTPDAWLDAAQLFRMQADGSTKVFSIGLRQALAGNVMDNLLLQPRDRIVVHRLLLRVDPPRVYVQGDVAHPGKFPLAANMRVSDLVQAAGGMLRSASPENGDLVHYARPGNTAQKGEAAEHFTVNLSAALSGNEGEDAVLRDGDVLAVPQRAGWKDIGATITLDGEVRNPGTYGIRSGERLSGVLARAGGFMPTAFPAAAVFERVEVRQLQEKARQELIQRLEREAATTKFAVTSSASEQAEMQQAAYQQRERAIEGVRKAPATGRLVVNLSNDLHAFATSPGDIEVRAGDTIAIPKRPGFVLVVGQVYNSNAITYQPHKSAGWYLRRAGGPTHMADRGNIFIIRGNGSVESGRSGLWGGGVLSRPVGPGDTIVVPEKAIGGGVVWKNLLAIAQLAQAGALSAAVAIR